MVRSLIAVTSVTRYFKNDSYVCTNHCHTCKIILKYPSLPFTLFLNFHSIELRMTTRELLSFSQHTFILFIMFKLIYPQKMCQTPCWYIFADRSIVLISVFGSYFEEELIFISDEQPVLPLFLKGLEENLPNTNFPSFNYENYNIFNKINIEEGRKHTKVYYGIYCGSLLIFKINGKRPKRIIRLGVTGITIFIFFCLEFSTVEYWFHRI